MRRWAAGTVLAILGAALLTGCRHPELGRNGIVLDGYSDNNYARLDKWLGARVCVTGKMTIDDAHHSVYFPLKPIVEDDVITIGFSRIVSGLSYGYAYHNDMVDGGTYRVCGTLRDATPFRHCDDDDCRWYRLEDSRLR